MALIRLIFWVALFLVATFAFTVLFEHGPTNYVENFQKEAESLKTMYASKTEHQKTEAGKVGR